MLCGGGGGVTEGAPGPRDRAAEGGSEGVKNCYGKKNMHFRILTRRHAPTGHPHRTRTPRHAPRMRMRQHATLRRATLDRREHAPQSIRRETTLERYRHRCRFRIRCVPIQVRAMHSVPVWESVIDCSPGSHRLAQRTSRDLW